MRWHFSADPFFANIAKTTGYDEDVKLQLHLQRLGAGEPLIILHGLFGNLDNWGAVARRITEDDQADFEIISLDLRNHGESPHASSMSYREMAEDVIETLTSRGLTHYHLLGHSMGGKVAMAMADHYNSARQNPIRSLTVVDIAPRLNKPTHLEIIAALQAIDTSTLASRGDANNRLSHSIPIVEIRQFLLKNLQRQPTGTYAWKLNLDAIANHYDQLLINPLEAANEPISTPTLIIRGAQSDYVTDTDLERFRTHFPTLTVHTVEGAGHWPHASHTEETKKVLLTFLNSQQVHPAGI